MTTATATIHAAGSPEAVAIVSGFAIQQQRIRDDRLSARLLRELAPNTKGQKRRAPVRVAAMMHSSYGAIEA